MTQWVDACAADDVEPEEAIRFDHAGKTYAIFRNAADGYFATDGLCTHEAIHLAGGYVEGDIVECPKHSGRFDYTTGKAVGAPACINLRSYRAKLENGRVWLELS